MKQHRSLLLLILITLISLFSLHQGQGWGGDFAQYLAQTRALFNHNVSAWLLDSEYMISHSPTGMGVVVAPWGYSVLIYPLYALFQENLLVYKLLNICIHLVTSWMVYKLAKEFVEENLALFVLATFGLSYPLMSYLNHVITDPLFLGCNVAGFLLLVKYLHSSRGNIDKLSTRKHIIILLLLGIVSFYSYFVKSQGIVLLCTIYAIFGWKALRTKSLQIVEFIPIVLFAIGFVFVLPQFPMGKESSLYFLQSVTAKTIATNIRNYATLLRYFLPFAYPWKGIVSIILFVSSIPCIVVSFKQFQKVLFAWVYIVGMMVILILFPWPSGIRYLFPIYPLYLLLIAVGIQEMHLRGLHVKTLCITVGLIFLAECIQKDFYNIMHHFKYEEGSYSTAANEAFQFIDANLPHDAIVLFVKPRVMYLRTGHLGFSVNEQTSMNIKKGMYFLDLKDDPYEDIANRIRYVKLEKKQIFENGKFSLYQIQ